MTYYCQKIKAFNGTILFPKSLYAYTIHEKFQTGFSLTKGGGGFTSRLDPITLRRYFENLYTY